METTGHNELHSTLVIAYEIIKEQERKGVSKWPNLIFQQIR